MTYTPTLSLSSFQAAIPGFLDGSDTPRAYLERCLEILEAREPEIQAFVTLNLDHARAAADAASKRYKEGAPISRVDGMPIGIKDVFETFDMPTEVGSPIYKDYQPRFDGATVWAFRAGGAAIVGKTVTTEFAFGTPGPTRNPWDSIRTPGGSSSGSGAAVGAAMVPVATGTQVRGSVLRPAAYCGAYALKPSHGAINQLGGFPSPSSFNHVGIIAGSLSDMWTTGYWLSRTAGGDSGHPSLAGELTLPKAGKPKRLIRLDMAGWAETPESTRAIYEDFLGTLADAGVEIVGRSDDAEIEAFEADLIELRDVIDFMLAYDYRWPLGMFGALTPELMGDRARSRATSTDGLTPERYAECLDFTKRAKARYAALMEKCDGMVTLNSTGPAPEGMPVGNVVYGEASSLLGVPALNLPVMAEDGMPLGLQVLGAYRKDWELTALGHWIVHRTFRGED